MWVLIRVWQEVNFMLHLPAAYLLTGICPHSPFWIITWKTCSGGDRGWLGHFSHFDRFIQIYSILPNNNTVYSLMSQHLSSRFGYVWRSQCFNLATVRSRVLFSFIFCNWGASWNSPNKALAKMKHSIVCACICTSFSCISTQAEYRGHNVISIIGATYCVLKLCGKMALSFGFLP